MPPDDRIPSDGYEEIHAKFERQRAELRARIAREQRAVDDLLDEVNGWQQAKAVRRYVRAVEAWAARNGTRTDHVDWIAWALEQADRFDPLCDSPA